MTKEDQKATIAALLEERRGYENRQRVAAELAANDDPVVAAKGKASGEEMDARLALIADKLKELGYGATKRSAKAEKRPAQRRAQAAKR